MKRLSRVTKLLSDTDRVPTPSPGCVRSQAGLFACLRGEGLTRQAQGGRLGGRAYETPGRAHAVEMADLGAQAWQRNEWKQLGGLDSTKEPQARGLWGRGAPASRGKKMGGRESVRLEGGVQPRWEGGGTW